MPDPRLPWHTSRPAYWRGVATGLRASASSPSVRSSFDASFRLALFTSVIASYELLGWVKQSRAAHGQLPLSTPQELILAIGGALGATMLVHLVRWLWRRTHAAP
jgi:hypothetical protein